MSKAAALRRRQRRRASKRRALMRALGGPAGVVDAMEVPAAWRQQDDGASVIIAAAAAADNALGVPREGLKPTMANITAEAIRAEAGKLAAFDVSDAPPEVRKAHAALLGTAAAIIKNHDEDAA